MKIIKVVYKNVTGLDFPMFLIETENGDRRYLPEEEINKTNYIQISIFDL